MVLLACVSTKGQSESEKTFMETMERYNTEINTLLDGKNYQQAEQKTRDFLNLFEKNRADIHKDLYFLRSRIYLLLGEMQKERGNIEEAKDSYVVALSDPDAQLLWHDIKSSGVYDLLKNDPRVTDIIKRIKETSDYVEILKNAPKYSKEKNSGTLPLIMFAPKDDPKLAEVRECFNLDSVAAQKSDVERIKAVLAFVNNLAVHNGSVSQPEGEQSAIAFAKAAKNGRALNCRGMATVLNECLLAIGIPSCVVTCQDKEWDSNCHVINSVYCRELGKWLWIDPTFNAWVVDGKGKMLSIQEARERIRCGKPVHVNDEAYWNHSTKQNDEIYLDEFMIPCLYGFSVWTHYGVGTESDQTIQL